MEALTASSEGPGESTMSLFLTYTNDIVADGPMVNSMSTSGNLPGSETEQQNGISADEIALYDRQIRLWGVKAQERIRSAKVLLVTVKAIGAEIAKNLILNGIGSLTIIDNGQVIDNDLGAQYFIRDEDIGLNRAQAASTRLQELNPRVAVIPDISDVTTKGPDFYSSFDMIIATDLPFFSLSLINAAARMAKRPFYATGIHGFYGFIFADLIEHEYIIEREQSNRSTAVTSESTTRSIISVATKKENGKNIELVTKRETYTPIILANSSPLAPEYLKNRRRLKGVTPLLPALRALWDFERNTGRFPTHSREDLVSFTTLANEKLQELQLPVDTLKSDFLRSFMQNVGSEIVPTAAFVGGRLSEDAINVLGKREQPIQNLLLFDGENFQAPIYALHPIFEENGTAQQLPPAPPVDAGTMPQGNVDRPQGVNGGSTVSQNELSTMPSAPVGASQPQETSDHAGVGAATGGVVEANGEIDLS